LRIAVFVSGRGSNLQAILNSQALKNIVEVKAVVSDKIKCIAFEIAEKYSIPVYSIGEREGCIDYEKLSNLFASLKIDLIVLAGFLKLIPNYFIAAYKGRIINIHPALLPSFGGKGMYGLNVHRAVFESSARVSGVSIHFVDETYDTGKIIAQECTDISDAKSPEEIAERVLKVEHKLLPYIVGKLAEGKVKIINNRVIVE
jgi:formyltetrahydrofolate-dependent phosphoribosylglycinamide formyltransferase